MPEKRRAGTDDPEQTPVLVVDRLDQFKALSHPLRQRVLTRLAEEPRSTKQVAELLGEKPTRLYHHVAALEKAGLVRLVRTQQKRGTTEKYYSAVARRFHVDPTLFQSEAGGDSPEAMAVAMVNQLLEKTSEEVALLARELETKPKPPGTGAELGVFTHVEIHGSSDCIRRVREKIEKLLESLEEEDPADEDCQDGQSHRLILGFYPLPRCRSNEQ